MEALVRAIKFSLFGMALTSIMVCWGASTHFYYNRPLFASPEVNRTYALNIHGREVYVTRGEQRLIDWSFNAGFWSILIGLGLLAIETNCWERRSDKGVGSDKGDKGVGNL